MPLKPPRICACGYRVEANERCACQQKRDFEHKRKFDLKRPSAQQRGYNGAWQKARADFLRLNPICRRCGAPSTVVHHIQPHRGNKALFWNRANWFPACKPCHDGPLQSAERKPDQ